MTNNWTMNYLRKQWANSSEFPRNWINVENKNKFMTIQIKEKNQQNIVLLSIVSESKAASKSLHRLILFQLIVKATHCFCHFSVLMLTKLAQRFWISSIKLVAWTRKYAGYFIPDSRQSGGKIRTNRSLYYLWCSSMHWRKEATRLCIWHSLASIARSVTFFSCPGIAKLEA